MKTRDNTTAEAPDESSFSYAAAHSTTPQESHIIAGQTLSNMGDSPESELTLAEIDSTHIQPGTNSTEESNRRKSISMENFDNFLGHLHSQHEMLEGQVQALEKANGQLSMKNNQLESLLEKTRAECKEATEKYTSLLTKTLAESGIIPSNTHYRQAPAEEQKVDISGHSDSRDCFDEITCPLF